jgi:predicted nucleic acid-binding protein
VTSRDRSIHRESLIFVGHLFGDQVKITLLPFDSDVAKRGAKLRHDLRQQSIRTRDRGLDLQIAATALHHGLEMVTYNTSDYDDIAGLTLYQI